MNYRRLRRGLRQLGLGALALVSLSCQGSTQQKSLPPPGAPGAAYPPQPPSGVASSVERHFAPPSLRQRGSAPLFLPGSATAQQVQFETVDGQAILEGDILLGPATALPFRYGIPWQSSLDSKSAVAVSNRSYLWPNGEIPYVIDATAQSKLSAITWAVRQFDSTPLRLRPRQGPDRDYVIFRDTGAGCMSYLGRQGGPQDIDTAGCSAGSIAHEILHAAGFYHEQSRGDRDQHITIVWDEISPEMRLNFEKRDARGQDIGPYDYGSIMHYPSHAGSKSGNPTIVPRAANVRIGQREGLSPLDRAGIETLYGRASGAPALAVPAPTPVATSARPAPAASTTPPPSVSPSGTSLSANASFTGTYGSVRGNVSCTQGGVFAQCQYPGGSLFCAASGSELSCTWSGGGQGRAAFVRQLTGVLAGTWGDGFSATSRGSWDLVPLTAGLPAPLPSIPIPTPPITTPPIATTPPVATAPPATGVASLSGNFATTRGAMACVESGASVSCNFREPDGVNGRLDCTKSQSALELSCAWITFLPRPGTGRAIFTRASPAERRLAGTWGHFLSTTGGGTWDLQGQ